MTPYKALYGCQAPSFNYHQAGKSTNDCVNTEQKFTSFLQKAQERMKFYADKRRTEREFKEGDEVFLKLQAFKQNSMKLVKDNKFTPRYFGPYKVLKRVGSVAYRLQLPATFKIHDTFHVSLLKKKIGPTEFVQEDPPVAVDFPSPAYPSKILDRRMINWNNAAVVSVLVQWEGMAPEDASWIDYNSLRRSYPQFVDENIAAQERGNVKSGE